MAAGKKITDEPAPPDPVFSRGAIVGHDAAHRHFRQLLDRGGLSHGWILAGPPGIGKATLAAQIAKAKLAPGALIDGHSLNTDNADNGVRQVTGLAHPDLIVARRRYDEKKQRLETEIPVDRIRALTQSLSLTTSGGHGRVAIIDTADEMNRNAANALLKILEEPPANTLVLLLSHAPGRLLATIRSRCRRYDLRAVDGALVDEFLKRETGVSAQARATIVAAAGGRPGYALALAENDGAEILQMAEAFLAAALSRQSVSTIAEQLSKKSADDQWTIFRDRLVAIMSERARGAAVANDASGEAAGQGATRAANSRLWVRRWEVTNTLCERGERLNMDRASLLQALAHDLGSMREAGASQ
ncbi:MAG: DNA polymerase III subunit delta' [Pseudomonadota bacterium]